MPRGKEEGPHKSGRERALSEMGFNFTVGSLVGREERLKGGSMKAGLLNSGQVAELGPNLGPMWLQKDDEVVRVESQLAWKTHKIKQ